MLKLIRRILIAVLAIVLPTVLYLHTYHVDRVLAQSPTSVTLLSRTHTIDQIYLSMQGPYSNHADIKLIDSSAPQLLWLTGIGVELVGRDGATPVSKEYFCHANLVFSPDHMTSQRVNGPFTPSQDQRLFTLIPGRLSLKLPDGFGLPTYSDEPLDFFSMSLNLNEKEGSRDIRFRTHIDFSLDSSSRQPMHPLFRRALYGYEPIGKASPHTMCSGGSHPGAACGPFVGKAASNAFVASLDKTNTIHWLIPPGDYESHVPVTDQLDLPYDTTVHYVTAHLHPHALSLTLHDMTENKDIFTLRPTDFQGRTGVDKIEELSLPQGVMVFKDHQYELVTRYFNPTQSPIDAMSILYLYALDKKFEASRQSPAAVAYK